MMTGKLNLNNVIRAVIDRPFRNPCNWVPYGSTVHRTVEVPVLIFGRQKGFAFCGKRLRALP